MRLIYNNLLLTVEYEYLYPVIYIIDFTRDVLPDFIQNNDPINLPKKKLYLKPKYHNIKERRSLNRKRIVSRKLMRVNQPDKNQKR